MTPRRRRGFLPDDLFSRLSELALHILEYNPYENGSPWLEELDTYRPDFLLSGWETPPLPLSLPPELRYVCHFGGGVRNLIPRELIERGLIVTNWGSSASRTVAEGTLTLTLCTLRRFTEYTIGMHVERGWPVTDASVSLLGRRVGIHGFGNVARAFVRLARGFGCSIRSYDPFVDDAVFKEFEVERCDSLEELFSTSQVILEMAALTPQTRQSVTGELLRMLPPDGAFINTGRAGTVDTGALLKVAQEGRLQIGLDVYDEEPTPAENPFRGLKNVTLLPHVAGPTPDRFRDCGEVGMRNLENFILGNPLEALVTLDVYDRIT